MRILRSGREVVLLDRGRPLAVVKPVRPRKGLMDRLAAEGRLRPPGRSGTVPAFRPVDVEDGLSAAVIDEREERG